MQDIKLVFMPAGQPSAAPPERIGARGGIVPHKNVPRIGEKTVHGKECPTYILDIPMALDQFNQLAQS